MVRTRWINTSIMSNEGSNFISDDIYFVDGGKEFEDASAY